MNPRQNRTKQPDSEPRYVISVAARILGTPTYTLRYYERIGIIEPLRSTGNIRLYSDSDIAKLRRVKELVEGLGVNLAGVEIIMHMANRMSELQQQIEELENTLARRDKKI